MWTFRTLAVAVAICAGGCTAGDDGLSLDGGDTDVVDNPNQDCTGSETFVAGVSHPSTVSGATVAVMQAAPTPPDVGDNAWTVSVTDGAGAPVTGLTPTLTPWMPLHAHGLTPPDYSAAETAPGAYDVEVFDLIMPGLWEFTIDLAPKGEPDTAVFLFCAEG